MLPFLIIGLLMLVSPDYLTPLLSTTTGHMILIGCAVWMLLGILVMRKMISFDV